MMKKMMKKLLTIAAFAVCFGITTNIFAQSAMRGKPTPNPTPSPTPASEVLTARFEPVGVYGTNKVTMDNPSADYENGKDGVKIQFYAGASDDLTIQMINAQRYVIFDLSEASSSLNKPAWTSAPQWFKPGMNVLQAYKAKSECVPVDGVYNCNFVTRMNAGYLSVSGERNITYALLWNPETINNRPVNSPESTSFVNVNYQQDANGKDVFTITSLPNCATRANNFTCPVGSTERVIAGLEKTNKNSVTSAGQYVMPFTLIVRPK